MQVLRLHWWRGQVTISRKLTVLDLYLIGLPDPQRIELDKAIAYLALVLMGKTSVTARHHFTAEAAEECTEWSVLNRSDKEDIEGASIVMPDASGISKVALMCTTGVFESPIITTLLHLQISSVAIKPM
eukprot:4206522-Amphidinium_carterae.1